jgi:uncharacterized repeat protein (TIGR03803 family)
MPMRSCQTVRMRSWIDKLFKRAHVRPAPRRRARRVSLQTEALEPRWTPSLIALASLLDGPQGVAPYSTLIQDSNGNLFGTTFGGNPVGDGTVFEVDPTSGKITTLAVFTGSNGANPEGGLVMDSNGNLFGTTSAGGTNNEGTIFEIPSGGTLKTLFNFSGANGSNPSNETLLLDSNGNLFGTTRNGGPGFTTHQTGNGTVFELPKGSSALLTLASFSGGNGSLPFAGLVADSKGDLFGTTALGGTNNDGTVFEVQAGTNSLISLASFTGLNGASPECSLMIDTAGNLMGTTTSGGTSNGGVIFQLGAGSGTINPLASFSPSVDGWFPRGGLVEDAFGNFFGTTLYGGMLFNPSSPYSGYGAVYEYSSSTNTLAPISLFTGGSDGGNPSAGLLMDSSGNLFGAATGGGPENLGYGTVFEVPSGMSTIAPVAAFTGSVGAAPYGGLVEDSSGNLYGTAYEGGPLGYGSVFEVPKGTGTAMALATFNGANGATPQGNLILDSNGNLFGTTVSGGGSNSGTVFEVAKGSNTINTLVSFTGINGQAPNCGLLEDSNGNLFGTTFGTTPPAASGPSNGTVFEVLSGSNTLITLATFGGTGVGTNPEGGLVADSNGNLFGTTVYGGSGYGTIFEIPSGSGTIQTLASFSGSNGAYPLATLLLDSKGNLFGTTVSGGAFSLGTVFELKQGSSLITDLASFNGGNGAQPFSGLIETSTGMLIGTTGFGGINFAGPQTGFGVLYQVPSTGGTLTDLGLFSGGNGAQPAGTVLQDTATGNIIGPAFNGGVAGFGAIFALTSTTPPSINTTSLPNGTTGTAYSQTIQASGGTGTLTFSATGNVPAGLTLSTTGVLSGTPTTPGSYTFTVTVKDSGGQIASATYTIIIYGQATKLALTIPASAAAGASFTLTVSAVDGGGNTDATFNGTVTLTSSLGNDVSPTTVTLTNGTATVTASVTGAGNQTITASTSGLTSANAPITVSPGSFNHYAIAISGPSQVDAGSQVLVTVQAVDPYGNAVTSYTGPAVTPAVSPSTGATFPSSVSLSSQGFGLFLVTLNQAGSSTISVSGGTISSNMASISVVPGTPSVLAFGVQPQNTPTGVTLPAVTVQVEDRHGNVITTDNTDTVVIGIATGPGGFTSTSTTTVTVTNGVATFNNLTLTVPGTYSLSAVVPATFTGPNSSTFTILPLQVAAGSFVGTPSGFSLQFNGPILVNSTTPVLYGTSTPTVPAPAPSVIVTTDPANLGDTNAYVAGSLVLNAANTGLTFVATNTALEVNNNSPILPDGVYTVIVRGSAANNGFQAAGTGGGYLDGKGTGTAGSGDFVATFTVGAAAAKDDVVWVPPTAAGPGQSLNGPGLNQLASGYPIYLADTTGQVTRVAALLNYDPTVLTVTGTRGAGFSLSANSTPGHAVLIYNGPALPAGSQTTIGYLTATVVGGTVANPAPYKAKDLLHLASATLNLSTIPVVTSDGLHVVAYVGDADGNGTYSSGDAVLITRAILLTDTGFAAYPLVDPTVLADTDGSGFVPSDAPLQANEAGVGVRTANLPVPPLPSGVHFQPIANNVDPSLSVDRGPWTVDRSTVTVAVNIDDAHPAGSTGLIEGHLALTYDPRLFTVSAADVHAGSLLAGGWSVVPTIDPATGQIAIALSSTTPVTSTAAGSLVTIDFHAVGSNPSAIGLVSSATPNGQFVSTELEDAQGTFTLSQGNNVVTLTAPAIVMASSGVAGAGVFESPGRAVEDSGPATPSAAAEMASAALTVAAESGDAETASVPTPVVDAAPVHVATAPAHGAAGLVAATTSTVAGPLTALVFQLGGTAVGSVPTNAVLGWQHLADQLFQALFRTPSSVNDPALGGVVQNPEHALAGQRFLAQPSSEDLDSFTWDAAGLDLDLQGTSRQPLSRTLDQSDASPPAPTTADAVSAHAALDQLFSQDVDDTDLPADSE